jgi:hypothetical protein
MRLIPILMVLVACQPDAVPAGTATTSSSVAPLEGAALGGFQLAPYLLELDHQGFTVCWVTAEPSPTTLLVDGMSTSRVVGDGQPRRFHRATASDLQSDSNYRYRIGAIFEGLVRTGSTNGHFRVASFGHVAGTTEPGEAPIEPQVHALRQYGVDLTLVSGDITYATGFRDFARYFFRPFQDELATHVVAVAPGNHDAGFPMHVRPETPQGEIDQRIGFDYTVFRKLFPYTFGHPTEGGYSTFTRDHVRFIALSYCTDVKGGFERQLAWLEDVLRNDESEFVVVFLGGASGPPREYDEDALYTLLAKYDVDLALGGDGPGVFQDEVHGVPRFFAGSRRDVRRFFMIDFEPWSFSVRQVDVRSGPIGKPVRFETQRPKQVVRELDGGEVVVRNKAARHMFSEIDVASDAFDGIEIDFEWTGARSTALQVLWTPDGNERADLGGDAYFFRSRLLRVKESGTYHFRLHMPERHPQTDESYVLHDLMLKIATPEGLEPVDLASMIRSVRLVRDTAPTTPEEDR